MAVQEIRRVAKRDESRWRELWAGYIAFYRGTVTEEATAALWASLLADEDEVRGYVADRGEGPVGLVHYVFHRSTWSTQPICYLQDLYVDPEVRGAGVGRALIEHVYGVAEAAGSAKVHWLTRHDNAVARRLYDRIATETGFVQYAKTP